MEAAFPPVRDLDVTNVIWQLQQTQIATYIIVCSLTVVTWDWMLSLAEEYRVVKRCGRSATVLVYFLARSSVLTLCVLVLIFYVGLPDGDSCSRIFFGIDAMVIIGNITKAHIFLLRILAVYHNYKLVKLWVGAGLLVLVGTRLVGMSLVHVSPLGHTGYCNVTNAASIYSIALWLNWAYDTCIFAAISVRLTSQTSSTTKSGIISLIRGYGLPRATRHLLQDGQLYYFTVLASMLLAAIVAVKPNISPIFQAASTIPAIAMESTMVCQMLRAMIIRSMEADLNGWLAPAEVSDFELDTSLGWTMDVEFD
ncbi:hypothetical protein FIBSPDRAFT_1051167 [Athelia psychrophila]|uniref:DUF6533 domain-containing protein n=1 Tax=Athelia psychrophila TaxID=1759441 RepID=A0A165ZJT7_9AGAM|nr:hypothetical protein FIBSPDRAFT_1051167 [Fibularhizoctonia sp. CBS 109695]